MKISVVFFVAISLSLFGCSSQKSEPVIHIDCNKKHSIDWKSHTLYEVTYQCMPDGWEDFFKQKSIKEIIKRISNTIDAQTKNGLDIKPSIDNVFKALYAVKPLSVKSVILGQDPAPQKELSTGLAFSLPLNVPSSHVPSVQRLLLEVQNDGYCVDLNHANLEQWTDEGVLLLNTALTISCRNASDFCRIGSHLDLWHDFTLSLISYLNGLENPIAFIFLGSKAKGYQNLIDGSYHKVLSGGHPSPKAEGRRFFCKKYFRGANLWLSKNKVKEINWSLKKSCVKSSACLWQWDKESKKSVCSSSCE